MLKKAQIFARMPQQLAMTSSMLGTSNVRNFRQVNNLHEVVYTNNAELEQRTAKYLERTDKVYKPSQTLEFNREGELLLWSCDNVKHSTVYLKYPYCTLTSLVPLSWYLFFINPWMIKWQVTLSIFYVTNCFAWLPQAMYWKHIDKKIHKMYLLRGGKYVKIWNMNPMGDRFFSWAHISEMNLITEDGEDFANPVEEENFLNKTGQLKYEVQVEMDNYVDQAIT